MGNELNIIKIEGFNGFEYELAKGNRKRQIKCKTKGFINCLMGQLGYIFFHKR